ncbi:MAG: class I SAM-dependent methyltransferase, partial [Alphaproteobacteria bacterium]
AGDESAVGGVVVVCDLNAELLATGRDRALNQGRVSGLSWVCGDAEAVPLPDGSVDAYTIAFGLRNVTRIDQALRVFMRSRIRKAMSPVPPARSSTLWPGRGSSQSTMAAFQRRWMPTLMRSFMRS